MGGIELLSPLAEKTFKDNPAFREDLTVPVAAEDVTRLPINPQTKRFDGRRLCTTRTRIVTSVRQAKRCHDTVKKTTNAVIVR